MAITASFSPSAGAVSLKGGQPSVADTRGIQAFSPGGDDASFLDESNSALPPARLFAHLGYDGLIDRCTRFFTYTTPRIGWVGDSTRLVARMSIASPFRAAFMS
jgi:hypothetical protein